ncbi:MAG: alanine dehydrogenase [Bacteroidales bacterium]
MHKKGPEYVFFSSQGKLLHQEETLEVRTKKNNLVIGIPKEVAYQEKRVALAPEAVSLLTQNGHRVMVEKDAGLAAHFPDSEYSEAGGEIVFEKKEVFQADILLKIAPLTAEEINLMRPGQTLLSTIGLPIQSAGYFKALMAKKINAVAFELIKDKTNTFPLVRSMSEIAGNTSILIAAEYLCNDKFGKGRMFGGFSGITPTEVVILGAGTVGEFAVRAAMGLGAMVKVFDNSIYKLRRLQNNLNTRIFTSIIQPKVLLKALRTADVVIGAIHSPWGRTPVVVSEDMVAQMKFGSVIIDVSIDQGGCVETSKVTNHADPVFKKHDVTHYCVPNIASRVPHTASYAFSNFFAPVLLNIGEMGGIANMLKIDPGVRQGVYLFNGTLTNQYIGEHFLLPYQDIELLMAAFQ